jgi:hypothetical protein
VTGTGVKDFWKMTAVGATSALLSGTGVALAFIITFSVRNAQLVERQETNTENIKSLAASVEVLSGLFRTQLVETTRLQTRLDSYIDALRKESNSK